MCYSRVRHTVTSSILKQICFLSNITLKFTLKRKQCGCLDMWTAHVQILIISHQIKHISLLRNNLTCQQKRCCLDMRTARVPILIITHQIGKLKSIF